MSRGEKAPAASTPVCTPRWRPESASSAVPRWFPIVGRAGRSVSVGIHVTKPSRAPLGAPLSWPKHLLFFVASPVQARLVRFRRFDTPDGHRLWSSSSWSPVTEDTGGSSRQCRCRLASRRGSLRCHQIHPGGYDSTWSWGRSKSDDPRPARTQAPPSTRLLVRPARPSGSHPRRDPRVSTAAEAFTWMHPETRGSRTFAAYLLSIFKDVHPVGAPLAIRSSWRSDEAPRHAALASLWFERAPLEP
jgi:hypothetical protein